MPRRDVLKYAGTAIAVAALPNVAGCAADFGDDDGERAGGPPESELDVSKLDTALTVDVLRKEDFVYLKLAFVNLEVKDVRLERPPMGLQLNGQFWLGRVDPNTAAYIVAIHQPQHFFEETFDEIEPDAGNLVQHNVPPANNAPVKHRMSNTSRVAFRVPGNVTALPYELEPILTALASYQLNVVATATPQPPEQSNLIEIPIFNIIGLAADSLQKTKNGLRASRQKKATATFSASNPEALPQLPSADLEVRPPVPLYPVEPTDLQTAIELPYRLLLSPNVYGKFEHSPTPVKSAKTNRVELWHTRLTAKESWQQTVRAVWTREGGFTANNWDVDLQSSKEATAANANPIYGPMFAQDRNDIVHLSVNQTLRDEKNQPRLRAIPTKKLILSALGGWIDAKGEWPKPMQDSTGGPSLLNWDNVSTVGRDHFVRIVNLGYLYPFGHEAVWIRVTERKFREPPYRDTPYLWTKQFIIVTQPLLTYDGIEPKVARKWPFRSIRFKTLISPLLDPPGAHSLGTASAWPYSGGKPVRFELQGFDLDGNAHDFTSACIWVDFVDAFSGANNLQSSLVTRQTFANSWKLEDDIRRIDMSGQRVALAESDDVDDTRYSVIDMMPSAGFEQVHPPGHPPFIPQIDSAHLSVDTIRGLTGSDTPTEFEYQPEYVDSKWTGNPGHVFMRVKTGNVKLDFHKQAHKSGGFVSPSIAVTGLSRAQGIIGGNPSTFASGDFKPSDFFKDIKAKLFGIVNLFELIPDGVFDQAPKFLTQAMESIEKIFTIVQMAESFGSSITTEIDALLNVAQYLPFEFWKVVDAKRQEAVNQMPGLTADQKALLLRLWNRAAAVGFDKAAMDAEMNTLRDLIEDVTTEAEAIAGFLDQLATISEANAPMLAQSLTQALVGISGVANLLMKTLPTSKSPIDDGLRGQLSSAATQIVKLIDPAAVQTLSDAVNAFVMAQDAVKNLHVKLEWAPELQPWPNAQHALFWPNDKKGFRIGVEARGKASGGHPAGAEVYASLVDFKLQLLGEDPCIFLEFEKLIFKAGTAGKPEVDCVFNGVHFGGPLKFVETLRSFIPLDGFSDPPNVKVDEEGLEAKFTLPLPNVSIGVFSLENMAFSAGFKIPFIGEALTVSFAFCSREEPFALTVCMLGGGGFFAIHLSPAGIHKLEISLEARAALSLDFGVASGSISVAIGMYFAIEEEKCTLSGYFRLRGEVDVLGGLISASIELYLELTYESDTGKVTGYAMIEISVTVLFFTGTVTIECEKRFKGSNADPTFRDLMYAQPGYSPWDEYCDAFAA